MRKFAIALALATTALATPALARDHSFYAGIEGGVMLVEDAGFDVRDASNTTTAQDIMILDFKPGWDVDVVGGYDFGMVRVEGELGYKHASLDEVELRDQPSTGLGFGSHLGADGHGRSLSFMINGLLDLGDEDSWSGYVGPGIGIADVRYSIGGTDPVVDTTLVDAEVSQTKLAWQVVAGVRTALSPTLDLGLKYRFFNVPNLKSGNTPDDLKT
ncbi:outer membrane beta-barrel protein, partial [Sphingomonas sp. RG327]